MRAAPETGALHRCSASFLPKEASGLWPETQGFEAGMSRHSLDATRFAAVSFYIQQQGQEDKRLDQVGLFGDEGRLERLQD